MKGFLSSGEEGEGGRGSGAREAEGRGEGEGKGEGVRDGRGALQADMGQRPARPRDGHLSIEFE